MSTSPMMPHLRYSPYFGISSELFLGHDAVQIPSQRCQNTVPCTSSKSGVEQEIPVVHLCQSCRNGNEVAYAGDESAGDGSHFAVVVEVAFAVFHLLLVEKTHLAPFAVGKLVDDGATEIIACSVVD